MPVCVWALCDQAWVYALAGEVAGDQAIMESLPPADVGFSAMYHWQLARGVVALASGQPEQAQAIIAAAEVEAQQKGIRRDNRLGVRLRSDPALPLSEAVWLMFLEE